MQQNKYGSWWFRSGVPLIGKNERKDRHNDTIIYHEMTCDGMPKYKFHVSYYST